MANHHAVHGVDELSKHGQLFPVQFRPRPLNLRQVVMRIHGGGRVARKMFSAAQYPLPPHAIVERARQANHLLNVFSVAASAQRIVRVVIEGNVENRAEIEVESKQPEKPPRDIAVAMDQRSIATIAQLLGVRRLVPDQTEARNAAALLVDRDDRLGLAEIAQIVDQFPQLRRALDVPAKQNEAARLDPAKKLGTLRIELVSGNAGQNKLSKRISGHGVDFTFSLAQRNNYSGAFARGLSGEHL